MTKKNVLIVGANGLIGSHLCRYLSSLSNQNLNIFTADIAGEADLIAPPFDIRCFSDFIPDHDISVVVNLAAVSSESRCQQTPEFVNWMNVQFPCHLFEILRANTTHTQFVHASTEWVYGDNVLIKQPSAPRDLTNNGLGLYAASKLESEIQLSSLATSYNNLSLLRLGIVYAFNDSRCNSFINKALEAAVNNKLFVCSSGSSARRYVSIGQVCSAFNRVITATPSQAAYLADVQGPELLTNEAILLLIKQVFPNFRFQINSSSTGPSVRDILCTDDDNLESFKFLDILRYTFGSSDAPPL